jgi:hypothetical protein
MYGDPVRLFNYFRGLVYCVIVADGDADGARFSLAADYSGLQIFARVGGGVECFIRGIYPPPTHPPEVLDYIADGLELWEQ